MREAIDAVVSPAMGGVIIGHEMGRALGKPAMFVERPEGEFELRRGFRLDPGDRVLMVEDVVTTGLSSREAIAAIEEAGGKVVAAAALVDRSGGKADLGVPFTPLIRIDVPTYAADDLRPSSPRFRRSSLGAARPRDQPLRLGVNIDHVATIRNARGGASRPGSRGEHRRRSAGADGITAHLREDRRHITDEDIDRLMAEIDLPLNLEMAATEEMLGIALAHRPHAACIVPEKREERTTEGGLDAAGQHNHLAYYVDKLGVRALDVLPQPRGPENRYAWLMRPASIATLSGWVTCSCPTTSANFAGRYLRYRASATSARLPTGGTRQNPSGTKGGLRAPARAR